jgi:lipopolysaccharide biosynthesis glycosyltransferase
MTDRLDIGFCVDARYVLHLGAVIASVMSHAPDARFRFIVLHDGVPQKLRTRLQSVAPRADFFWEEIGDSAFPGFRGAGHFTRAILYRLAFEQRAPADCRRLLYLDTDVVVLRDVRDVAKTDLGGAPLAAVRDAFQDPEAFRTQWGLPATDVRYFNSGLLLIDLEQVRAEKLFSQAARFVAEHHASLLFPDQDALNYTFWGRWKALPLRWNVQRNSAIPAMAAELAPELRLDRQRPFLVHYTGPIKPWVREGYHPWSWLYWPHLARTPFFLEVCKTYGVGPVDLARFWVRWLRRRPRERDKDSPAPGEKIGLSAGV